MGRQEDIDSVDALAAGLTAVTDTARRLAGELPGDRGTTRQAAFQRFGRPIDPRTGAPMAGAILPGAADRALELLADVAEGRWREATRDFDDTMAARLGPDRLAAGSQARPSPGGA